jgi:hypothetical protein
MIWGTGVLVIVINISLALFLFKKRQYEAAGSTLIPALGLAWIFYSWSERILFAKLLLKTVVRVTGQFSATMFAGFIGLCVELGLSAFVILSAGNICFFLIIAGWLVKTPDAYVKNDTALIIRELHEAYFVIPYLVFFIF